MRQRQPSRARLRSEIAYVVGVEDLDLDADAIDALAAALAPVVLLSRRGDPVGPNGQTIRHLVKHVLPVERPDLFAIPNVKYFQR
jgi:hypothetical protein